MENSADNFNKEEDENACVDEARETNDELLLPNKNNTVTEKKPSTANTVRYVPSYSTLVANMEELKMNLENHLHLFHAENSTDDAKGFASSVEKNTNEHVEDSTSKDKFNTEIFAIQESFKQLATNSKALTKNEINEYEEVLKQNAFNEHAEKKSFTPPANNYSSEVNSDVHDSGMNPTTENLLDKNKKLENNEVKEADNIEEEAINAFGQLELMGYGILNLNVEELSEEDEQTTSIIELMKNMQNSLIKNTSTTKKNHE